MEALTRWNGALVSGYNINERRMKATLIFLLSLWAFFSCDSEDAFDCIKKTGDIVETELSPEDFHQLHVYDGINVYLSQGEETRIILKTGENLVKKIRFEFNDGVLSIYNDNTCNWVRSYDDLAVYITVNQLQQIKLWGYGNVKSLDTLRFDHLNVESKDGTGDIDLTIQCNSVNVVSNSISNITLSGRVDKLSVGYYYNDGWFHGEKLIARTVSVNHLGTNGIAIYPVEKLKVYIERNGEVYYYNDPDELETEIAGSGQLINKSR